jgi:hypothetical protein
MLEVESDKVTVLFEALNSYMTTTGLSEGYENENTPKEITIFLTSLLERTLAI